MLMKPLKLLALESPQDTNGQRFCVIMTPSSRARCFKREQIAPRHQVMITGKDWNEKGYDGLLPSQERGGKPPRLKEKDIERLQELLQQKDFWKTKEVRFIILKEFFC
jgi:hypothetical protein